MIARLSRSYAPRTVRLEPGQAIPELAVLKRSNSECGAHVILPTAPKERRTWAYLNEQSERDTFWMAQEYVPSLDQVGEWRAFVVGGNIISVMHTHKTPEKDWKGDWSGCEVESFLSLDEIRYVIWHCITRKCLMWRGSGKS